MKERHKSMTLISLTEWAKREGITARAARYKASSGLLETAQKIGRNWVIDEMEKNRDNRRRNYMKTWQIYDERYPADFIAIEEIEHDYDLHAFRVSYLGELIGTIYPDTIEQMDEIVTALDNNESPIGWEDGMGETISVGI